MISFLIASIGVGPTPTLTMICWTVFSLLRHACGLAPMWTVTIGLTVGAASLSLRRRALWVEARAPRAPSLRLSMHPLHRINLLGRASLMLLVLLLRPCSACSNTCSYAHDGECDDGGSGSEYSICALGTDCSDCGSRGSSGSSSSGAVCSAYANTGHNGASNPCAQDRSDYCCDWSCTYCGPAEYCTQCSPFLSHSGVCNPSYVGPICANHFAPGAGNSSPPPPSPSSSSSSSCSNTCDLRVESAGWYHGIYSRFYLNGHLQDFSGTPASGSSYDSPSIYEGLGDWGFNFVHLRVVDGQCKLERIGRGYDTYRGDGCVPLGNIKDDFTSGGIILVGIKDTGAGCSQTASTLAAAGAVQGYGTQWRVSYALIGVAGGGRLCEKPESIRCRNLHLHPLHFVWWIIGWLPTPAALSAAAPAAAAVAIAAAAAVAVAAAVAIAAAAAAEVGATAREQSHAARSWLARSRATVCGRVA